MEDFDEMYMIRTWEEFREMCAADALSWHDAGFKADDLTSDDIIDEYVECDESFFTANPEDARDGERAFSAAEVAQYTLAYMQEMDDGYDK